MKKNMNKLNDLKEFHKLTNQYLLLVADLTNIFNSREKKEELANEISLLEDILKSKLSILSMIKGF